MTPSLETSQVYSTLRSQSQPPPETPRASTTQQSLSQIPSQTTSTSGKSMKKSDAQRQKDKVESDRAYNKFCFTQYLEKSGIDKKMLQDER